MTWRLPELGDRVEHRGASRRHGEILGAPGHHYAAEARVRWDDGSEEELAHAWLKIVDEPRDEDLL